MKPRKKIAIVLVVVLILLGSGLLLFPKISNLINNNIATNKAANFDNATNEIQEGSYEDAYENGLVDEEGYSIDEKGKRTSKLPRLFAADLERLRNDSTQYNNSLINNQTSLMNNSSYEIPALDLSNYGIFHNTFGYIEAPTIEMMLPIYLGASNYVMANGIGHMNNTSLPISGQDSNVALAGHTGHISQIFFDNITQLSIGDTVMIHNYWETLTYEVSDTMIISPDDSQYVFITPGESKLTLITCISNGFGSFDRYLVICKLITE